MPSTGMPRSSSAGSSFGAPSAYTLAGPPDRISPFGRRLATSSTPTWCGSSSLKTPLSRTRRAISCEYCPPKSRTTTSSTAGGASTSVVFSSTTSGAAFEAVTRPASNALCLRELALGVRRRGRAARAHAHLLRALEVLALRLQRRRDHQLRPVELGDVLVARRGHRGAQAAH